MMECILCGSDNRLEYSITHQVFDDSLKSSRLWICAQCWNTHHQIHWCPRCKTGYTVDKEHPWWDRYARATPVVCVACSVSTTSAITECDQDACDSRLRPSKNITGRGRIYCANHWADVQRCQANYCSMIFHREDSGACVRRLDTRVGRTDRYGYFCLSCVISTIPPGFPVTHPNAWSFIEGCSCQACGWLAGKADKWPDSIDHDRERGTCTECGSEAGALDDMKSFNDGSIVMCHTCFFNALIVCDDCGDEVLKTMVHPIARHGHPIPPHFTTTAADSRARPAPGQSLSPLQRAIREEQARGLLDGGLNTEPSNGVCDVCIRDSGNYRLCAVACNAWFLADDTCNCDGVHRWSYKPLIYSFQSGRSQKTDSSITPYLGFELEVETVGPLATRRHGSTLLQDIAGEWAYAVHDGTLANDGQGGFEIVTHPFTFQWFNENWLTIETLLERLSADGYRSWEGGRCGMHVHISRRPMTEAHQMKFLQFIYGSANLAMCVGQRGPRDRGLTRFAPFDQEDRAQFLNSKIRGDVNPGAEGHYAALNANNHATYEARWFRGTLQPKSFRKNVEFVHAAWTFTRKFGFTSANESNFMEWLRGDPERRDYAMLLGYLENNYITRR